MKFLKWLTERRNNFVDVVAACVSSHQFMLGEWETGLILGFALGLVSVVLTVCVEYQIRVTKK